MERIDLSVNYLRSLPAGLFEGITKLNNLGLRQTQISTPVDPPAWAVELGLDPDMFRIRTGDETLVFHVHPELVQGNRIVAKVIEGAPFDISVMLSAEGGTLSANQVTIPAGSIKSPPVTVTPLSADRGMVTVKVTYAIFEGWDTFDHPAGACDCWGFRTGPGDPITVDATFATITGEPRVGETLTADTSYIQDPDGMENAEFSYQWVREDSGTETDIENATDSAYTIVAADVGKTITVRVSFTDDAGNEESLTSAETAAVAAIVPTQPLGLTVTRGDQTQELDASWQAPSSNGGSAITGYKVQWKEVADSWGTATGISEVAVTVTGTTYTITGLTGEVEYAIRVIATNEVGDGPPSGEQTGTPRETVPPDFKGPPSVDGATLLVSYDEALDEDSVPAADAFVLKVVLRGGSMYWQDESARRAVDGVSVTGSAVVLILAKAVTAEEYVVLSYTPPSDATAPRTRDVAGNAAPGFRPVQVSNNTEEAPEDKNPAPNTPATGEPTVSGTAQVGETLTADVSRIADEDGRENAEFSYQWLADDAEIQDATGSAYTLVAADEGKTVKVRVSFTDDEGHAETRTSTPTGAVAPNVGPRSRSVAENTAEGSDIGAPVAAGDSDGPVTYKLGGNGAASFDVVASTGQLQTKAALDYESKSSYGVTVIATDSDGTRTIPVTIEVTNVPELLPLVTGPASLGYEENGAGRVATYTASSAEDREGITWSLSGPDSDSFSVNRGILRFDIEPVAPNIFLQLPDFEGPVDVDGNNSYSVTVAASDGTNVITKDVTVTVGDQDEIGTLTLSTVRPQVDVPLTATLSDPDTVTGTTQWTWERSAGRNHWMVIDGANSASYTPAAADTQEFLRVTATYADRHGSGNSVGTVASRVVTGPLLAALTVETVAATGGVAWRQMRPTFSDDTLHYSIGCDDMDTMTLMLRVADVSSRFSLNGTQFASPGLGEVLTATVAVAGDSDVRIDLSDATGARTQYVVHCLAADFPELTVTKSPDAMGVIEDLMLFPANYYLVVVDNNGVPRFRRKLDHQTRTFFRFYPDGGNGMYRYSYTKRHSRVNVILDENLEPIDIVATVPPLTVTDGHDFRVLEDGNYLLMAYEPAVRDLSHLTFNDAHGDPFGTAVETKDSAIQIITPVHEAFFTWNSWDHMPLEDCKQHRFPPANGDWAHINSIERWHGQIIASFRGCSKVLSIDVDSAEVVWRLGQTNLSDEEWAARNLGPSPLDIVKDPEGKFCGQHAAQILPNGHLLLYDNGVHCVIDPWTGDELGRQRHVFSRAVEYFLDLENGEVVFLRDHSLHGSRNHLGHAGGHIEPLENGDWLISWGRSASSQDSWGFEPPYALDEAVTQVNPATGEEKLSFVISEMANGRSGQRITVMPAEALAPQPRLLEAEFPTSSYTSKMTLGLTDRPRVVVAFNQPVVDVVAATASVSVVGATVESVSPHVVPGERANAYIFTLIPAGSGGIRFSLVAGQPCNSGGICTANGRTLSTVPQPLNVEPGSNTPSTGAPTIRGTAQVGQTLTVHTSGIADADGLTNPAFAYQWMADDANIQSATDPTYTLTEDDEGKAIRVQVSFTDDGNNEESLPSAATDAVAAKPNIQATGVPTITGTVQVGQTLTADTSGIADEDGLTNVVFAYQWIRNDGSGDAVIAGATNPTYTLVSEDEGKTIEVTVSFTDGEGNPESLTSDPTGAVDSEAGPLTAFTVVDTSTDPDKVLGTLEDGRTLTLAAPAGDSYGIRVDTDSNHDDHDDIHKVVLALSGAKNVNKPEWEPPYSLYGDSGAGNLDGGNLPVGSYDLTATASKKNGDVLGTLKVSFTVEAQEQNVEPENNAPTGSPVIVGAAQVGETLTADTSGIADEDELTNVVFSYQWIRRDGSGDADIDGATGTTYTLTGDDEGKTIEVRVSFTDDEGNPETLTSDPTGEVEAKPNTRATGAPAIDGIARVGETLTADVSTIDDDDELTNAVFAYQWLRGDAEIAGATGDTYTLVKADEGQTIKVTVSFTDDRGHAESLTSDPTGEVKAAETVPGRPQDLAGEASAQGIALTWKAPAGSSVTQYVVYRGILQNGGMNGRPMTQHATIDAAGEAMAYTDANVESGVEYRYRVAAVNSAGEGKKSNWLDIEAGDYPP